MLKSVCTVLFLCAAAPPVFARPGAKVNIEDGAVLSDIVKVKAIPLANAGISKVEFSVDDQLRLTVTKPPYEYKWDTIEDDEGARRLIVSVYDTDGKATSKRIKVEIDNGLTLGIKPHADKAIALFREGDMKKAALEGRKAFRISQTEVNSLRVMGIAVGQQGDFTRAINMLELPPRINNQIVGDPKRFPLNDPAAMEIRGYLHVMRAASNPNVGGAADLAVAMDMARKLREHYVEEARAAHPELKSTADKFAVGDALFMKGDYDGALNAYMGASTSGADGIHATNRCALAMLYAGKYEDTIRMLNDVILKGQPNGGTYAVLGAVYLQQRKYAQAQKAIEPGRSMRSPAALAVAAQTDIAVRDYRRSFTALDRAAEQADLPELHYAAAQVYADERDLKLATQSIMEAIVRDPSDMNLYATRAYQLAALVPNDGMNQALEIFDAILQREPKHRPSMIGKAIILIYQKKYRPADELLQDLRGSDRWSADVWVAMAGLHAGLKEGLKVAECLAQARKLEPDRFPDTKEPVMTELAERVARYRRPPIITPALLSAENAVRTIVRKQDAD